LICENETHKPIFKVTKKKNTISWFTNIALIGASFTFVFVSLASQKQKNGKKINAIKYYQNNFTKQRSANIKKEENNFWHILHP